MISTLTVNDSAGICSFSKGLPSDAHAEKVCTKVRTSRMSDLESCNRAGRFGLRNSYLAAADVESIWASIELSAFYQYLVAAPGWVFFHSCIWAI